MTRKRGESIQMFTNGWIDKVTASVEKETKNLVDSIIENLQYIGEAAVRIARERGNYGNPTGSLRSSIGYSVLYDGEVVKECEPVPFVGENGNDGSNGVTAMRNLLEKIKAEYPRGIVLIVCAGMNYASYVEDIYGKDVLTSARLETERMAESMLKELLSDD